MKKQLLMIFFGGWLLAQPPLALSNILIDSSTVVVQGSIGAITKVAVLSDSLRAEELPLSG